MSAVMMQVKKVLTVILLAKKDQGWTVISDDSGDETTDSRKSYQQCICP
jgi:hypothetical protein